MEDSKYRIINEAAAAVGKIVSPPPRVGYIRTKYAGLPDISEMNIDEIILEFRLLSIRANSFEHMQMDDVKKVRNICRDIIEFLG